MVVRLSLLVKLIRTGNRVELGRVARVRHIPALGKRDSRKRWRRLFGRGPEIFKWNVRGDHAADLIAGSVAKYASSGV